MEIEFIEEKENKLFNRKEIKFYVDYDGEATPKVLDIKSKLVALLNTKKELIVVDNVQPHYGEPKALGYAKVYLYEVDGDKIVRKNQICPRCGEGVFMADHGDRVACGKCGYTEMKK